MRNLWRTTLDWFERGDLVPLLIVVSAAHYVVVLAGKDFWPVAVAIGVLVDLGHYRWVRAAARYEGTKPGQVAVRWLFAIILTAISLGYHQRYYQDWLLSAPIPLLIASLAWLAKVDQRAAAKPAAPAAPAVIAEPSEAPKRIASAQRPMLPAEAPLYCEMCGRPAASQNALNAHMRAHRNGHKEPEHANR
jgi:hypothetical protein